MTIPNGGLINETNAQYYAGSQQKYVTTSGVGTTIVSTFDTDLVVGTGFYADPGSNGYNLNNFKVFTSPTGNVWTELTPTASRVEGTVSNATGLPSTLVDLSAYNADIQAGMVVVGLGVATGTTVLTAINPGTNITGNAYVPFVQGNVQAKVSDYDIRLTTDVTAAIVALGTNAVVDDPAPGGVGTWVNYIPPTRVLVVATIAGVTEIAWSKQQAGIAVNMLLRFQPAITGTNTLTLTTYNANILAGMGISGNYIPAGTTVVSNTNTNNRSVLVLSNTMTQRADSNAVYTFTKQEITLDQNATVVNGEILTFTNNSPFSMLNNVVTINSILTAGTYVKIQMNDATVNDMHGSYEYTRLDDVIENFMVAYVGAGKLIPSVKRTDVIFHARRGLQEFSYDTLKSTRSQELQVPSSLSLIIPQDYVNYVRLSWVDKLGVLHTIYPTNNLNQSPYETLAQDDLGKPIQDSNASNTETNSEMDAAWAQTNPRRISGGFINNLNNSNEVFDQSVYDGFLGQRYGLEPQVSQQNGWFKINEREGTFNFTSNLAKKIILLEYISDGNAYDLDSRIPKLAEEALYSHIMYAILSVTRGIQEYIVRRFQKERSAKLRNAKIRLSNLKLDQIVQVMRGKSKWIKY